MNIGFLFMCIVDCFILIRFLCFWEQFGFLFSVGFERECFLRLCCIIVLFVWVCLAKKKSCEKDLSGANIGVSVFDLVGL